MLVFHFLTSKMRFEAIFDPFGWILDLLWSDFQNFWMDCWSHFSISESFFRLIFLFLAFGSQSFFFPALEGSNMPPHTILPCFMLFQLSTLLLLPIHNPATSRASLARHPTPFFPALKVLKLLLITILLCFVFLQLSTLTLLPFIILKCLVLL